MPRSSAPCRNAEEIARLSPENPEAMPSLGAADLRARVGVLRRRGERDAGVARVVRADRHRVEQEAGRRVGRLRRDPGGDSGDRQLEGTVRATTGSPRPTTTSPRGRLTAPAPVGRRRRSTSCGSWIRRRSPATAIDKAAQSKSPVAIEPGKYTVVLEPAAVADLLAFMMFSCDARQADEGRSFFSKKGGGNRVGEQIVGEKVRDPVRSRASAGADAELRQRRPAAVTPRLGRQRRAEGPVLLAVLGGEDGEGTDRRTGRISIMEGGTATARRSHRRHRARRAGHALLVHPAARSADHPGHRA